MKITIELTKGEINHIYPKHYSIDSCDIVKSIIKKIQREIKMESLGK